MHNFSKNVLKHSNLKAKESLFIDDQHINAVGAQKAGIHAFIFDASKKRRNHSIISRIQYC